MPPATRFVGRVAAAAGLALSLVAATVAHGAPGAPGGAAMLATTDTVWCHDASRSLVTRKARWRCDGEVVDAAEAERIKAERVRRIQGVLERERKPLVPGKRLAGTGTGFTITVHGDVLTNHHVIKGCGAVTVTQPGKAEQVAKLRGTDPRRDLALLTLDGQTPDPAVFASDTDPSETPSTTVVGYPLHGRVVVKPRMVTGQFHRDGQPSNPNVFAMKIDVRRGNSGGPILDESGRVIGVVFAKVDTPAIYARTGKLIRNVGLGIRLPTIRDFLRRQGVQLVVDDQLQPLTAKARFARARQFVAQIRCYR